MCFYNDEHADLYRETIHKARKAHHCLSCNKTIQPGEQYLLVFTLFEGSADNTKICNLCVQDAVAIHRHEIMSGCRGSESWCPWDQVAIAILNGNEDEYYRETDDDEGEWGPTLFWPYGVAPASQHVDLKTLAELQANKKYETVVTT